MPEGPENHTTPEHPPPDEPTVTETNQAEEFVSTTIEDYLLTLADSVYQAQAELNRLRLSASPGQPAISYHIPEVEFELRLVFELNQHTEIGVRPIEPGETGHHDQTAQETSVISGKIVAIPADGGRPTPIIRVETQHTEQGIEFKVTAHNATGEPLVNIPVQFNIDQDLTRELNHQHDLDMPLQPGTGLRDGVVTTGPDGSAATLLTLDPAEPVHIRAAVTVDLLDHTETIVYRLEPDHTPATFGTTKFGDDTFEGRPS